MAWKRKKWASQELPATAQQCPQCGGKKLVLPGTACKLIEPGTQSERTDERILQLLEEVEKLRFQLAFVTGRLVPENRLPC